MNLHFAGMECAYCNEAVENYTTDKYRTNTLESFWIFKYKSDDFLKKLHERYVRMKASGKVKKIIVDSGAHSILAAHTGAKDTKHLLKQIRSTKEFTADYVKFIDMFKDVVDYFFELDTAPFTFTYEEQLEERERFFKLVTNREQFMPVYHVRYNPENLKTCLEYHYKNYPYIGIGYDMGWDPLRFQSYFELKKNYPACKVHGLALTSLDKMKQFPFYSVDSTTYIHNVKSRQLQMFDIKTGTQKMLYLGRRERAGQNALYQMNKAHHKPVFEYAAYLREKYGMKIEEDLFYIGDDCAVTKGPRSYLHAISLYNMASFMEMEEYINTHGHEFTEKKQGELFDLLGG